jgi:hypothetical protein
VSTQPTSATDPRDAEIADLRARVAELEAELGEQARSTAQLVAVSQEKLYWLERWHVDLDRVMRKPGAIQALDALRATRGVVWKARKLARRAKKR